MSDWISVKDGFPESGRDVDVFVEQYDERWCNYRYLRDYNGSKGNDFFDPIRSGLCCIRNASHWMYVPENPK